MLEFIVVVIIIAISVTKNKDKLSAEIYKANQKSRENLEKAGVPVGKTKSQTNGLSKRIEREEMYMNYLDMVHDDYSCKYTTRDPNFSFNGRPNNYDDFAELRRKNAEHEKHLQQRIY